MLKTKSYRSLPPPRASKRGGELDRHGLIYMCHMADRRVQDRGLRYMRSHERYKGLCAHTILTPGKCVVVLPFVDATLAPVAVTVRTAANVSHQR